ncbi:MAG TPA: hypothetical protein VFE60_08735 [Roseiarcus sp.]|nr:hypothetical protein [Roseiarcus sp.]
MFRISIVGRIAGDLGHQHREHIPPLVGRKAAKRVAAIPKRRFEVGVSPLPDS